MVDHRCDGKCATEPVVQTRFRHFSYLLLDDFVIGTRLATPQTRLLLRPNQLCQSAVSRFCQGHRPVTSTSSEKLRNVRMTMMPARVATLVRLGEAATVRTMSPAPSSSRPSRMVWPSCRRRRS